MKLLSKTICLCAVVGGVTALQSYAADQNYFKVDAGVALPQDLDLKEVAGIKFPATLTSLSDDLGVSLPAGVPAGAVVHKPKITFDPGARVDFAFGHHLSDSVALEIEGGVAFNSTDKMKVTVDTASGPVTGESKLDLDFYQVPLLLNLVYNFPLQSNFKPYIGVGAGGIYTDIVPRHGDGEDNFTFAYQGMAGVNYAVSDSFSIGVGYKFLGTLDQKFEDVKTDMMMTHAVLLNFVFKF
jgi:opacity protein-like surface antigen